MPRGKGDTGQYLEAYKLHASGNSRTDIWNKLKERYRDNTVTTRSIGTWQQEFRALPPKEVEQDREFEWDRCESYGIPWTGSIRLLELITRYVEIRKAEPTGRQVKWVWRVSQTKRNYQTDWLINLGFDYAERELSSVFVKQPKRFADLNIKLLTQPPRGER